MKRDAGQGSASGVAEVAFAGVFSVFMAKNALALVTIAWRFFMLYVPSAGLGIFFILAANDARRQTPPAALPGMPVVEPIPAPSSDQPAGRGKEFA